MNLLTKSIYLKLINGDKIFSGIRKRELCKVSAFVFKADICMKSSIQFNWSKG